VALRRKGPLTVVSASSTAVYMLVSWAPHPISFPLSCFSNALQPKASADGFVISLSLCPAQPLQSIPAPLALLPLFTSINLSLRSRYRRQRYPSPKSRQKIRHRFSRGRPETASGVEEARSPAYHRCRGGQHVQGGW